VVAVVAVRLESQRSVTSRHGHARARACVCVCVQGDLEAEHYRAFLGVPSSRISDATTHDTKVCMCACLRLCVCAWPVA
jgi:hypothetical protein